MAFTFINIDALLHECTCAELSSSFITSTLASLVQFIKTRPPIDEALEQIYCKISNSEKNFNVQFINELSQYLQAANPDDKAILSLLYGAILRLDKLSWRKRAHHHYENKLFYDFGPYSIYKPKPEDLKIEAQLKELAKIYICQLQTLQVDPSEQDMLTFAYTTCSISSERNKLSQISPEAKELAPAESKLPLQEEKIADIVAENKVLNSTALQAKIRDALFQVLITLGNVEQYLKASKSATSYIQAARYYCTAAYFAEPKHVDICLFHINNLRFDMDDQEDREIKQLVRGHKHTACLILQVINIKSINPGVMLRQFSNPYIFVDKLLELTLKRSQQLECLSTILVSIQLEVSIKNAIIMALTKTGQGREILAVLENSILQKIKDDAEGLRMQLEYEDNKSRHSPEKKSKISALGKVVESNNAVKMAEVITAQQGNKAVVSGLRRYFGTIFNTNITTGNRTGDVLSGAITGLTAFNTYKKV